MRHLSMVLVVLLFAPLAMAQEGSDAKPPALTEIKNDVLLARIKVAAGEVGDEKQRLDGLSKPLDSNSKALAGLAEQLSTNVEPKKPTPVEGATEAAIAKARVDYATALVKVRSERAGLLSQYGDALKAQLKTVNRAIAQAAVLDARYVRLRALMVEVDRRVGANSLAAEQAKEALGKRSAETVDADRAALKAVVAEWRKRHEAHTAQEKLLEERRARAKQGAAAASKMLELAARTLRGAVARESQMKAFADKGAPALVQLLGTLTEQVANGEQRLVAQRKKLAELEAKLAKEEKALAALQPPDKKALQVPDLSRITSVRKAQTEHALAVAMQTYLQKQGAMLASLAKGLPEIAKGEVALRKAQKTYADQLLQLEVLIGRLGELVAAKKLKKMPALPKGCTPEELRARWTKQSSAQIALSTKSDGHRRRVEMVAKRQKDVVKALASQAKQVEEKQRTLDTERDWARWIVAVEKLETQDLLVRYVNNRRTLEGMELERRKRARAVEAAEAHIREVREAIGRLTDPLQGRVKKALSEHHKRVNALVARAAKGDAEAVSAQAISVAERAELVSSLAVLARGAAPDGSEKTQKSDGQRAGLPGSEETEEQLGSYERHLHLLAGRVRYGRQQTLRRQQLIGAHNELRTALLALVDSLEKQLAIIRRRYGIALELQLRQARGQVAKSSLPETIEADARRQPVIDAQLRIATLRKRADDAGQTAAAGQAVIDEAKAPLAVLAERLRWTVDKLDALREGRALESAYGLTLEKLRETERNRLEQEVHGRLKETRSVPEGVLLTFQGARADQLTELLVTYYRELQLIERREQNLDKRILIFQRIIKLIEKERVTVSNLLPIAQRMGDEAALQLATTRVQTIAPLIGGALRQQVLANYTKETGKPAPPLERLTKANRTRFISEASDRLFRAEVSLLAMRIWYRSLIVDLSELGLETETAILRDQIGVLESKKAQLTPDRKRLTGHSQSELDGLNKAERPRSIAATKRFLKGDIQYTRDERFNAMMYSACYSLLTLLLIPLAGFILVRLANGVCDRIVRRVNEDEGSSAEREVRAETLTSVFRAVWTTIVMVVCVIYMLEQLRVDIAPLIASAGVVGLAAAFGAQKLIGDFFAGFFILLENQYALGDRVRIDGTEGVVEKMSLRMTMVRDSVGTVHYLPNGSIGQISNLSKQWSGALIDVEVNYDQPMDLVEQTLLGVGQSMLEDEEWKDKMVDGGTILGIESFGNASAVVMLLIKAKPGQYVAVGREARRRIQKAFKAADVIMSTPEEIRINRHEGDPPA